MKDFAEKTAFITGGASGLGFAMAQAFLQQGMNVVIADIDNNALAGAQKKLATYRGRLATVNCDVANRDSVQAAAAYTFSEFGNLHVLCNNAGVGVLAPIDKMPREDWEWAINICQWGVINGLEAFLPHMKSHGEAGHIVNTASMAGMVGMADMAACTAAKFAIVGISECLNAELAGSAIGVSILCPSLVRTHIFDDGHTRVANDKDKESLAQYMDVAMPPEWVAAEVLACIRAGQLYIFTHPETSEAVDARFAAIRQGYQRATTSPVLRGEL